MASVRVCARFRPPNSMEKREGAEIVVKYATDDKKNMVFITAPNKYTFAFDRVFEPNSTQEEVFEYTGQLLVEQGLEGFNVTMFAYGQTGSGKTYTMEGVPDNPGVIPRMVDLLFEMICEYPEDVEFLIRISFVEIYNEKIRDLLEPRNCDLRVREHKDRGVYIEGCEQPYVGSPEEVLELMAQGHLSREVTATAMNAGSSRSHAVFMLGVEQRDTNTGSKKDSKIMLVDLAGSEKVRKTKAKGKLLKEAQNINRSLTCLGSVINSLTEGKRTHIPYRDSKLTRLLSDSLGGNSKTCIVVACSPCKFNIEESVSTLRFGQRCKNVKNKPKVNEELSIREYKKMVQKLEKKRDRLKAQVDKLQNQNKALRDLLAEGDALDIDEFLNNLDDISDVSESVDGVTTPRHRSKASISSDGGHYAASRIAGNASMASLHTKYLSLEESNINLNDQLQDLRNELGSTERERDEYRDNMEKFRLKSERLADQITNLQNLEQQLKFYRLKVDCLQDEHKKEVEDLEKRLKQAKRPRESLDFNAMNFSGSGAESRAFKQLAGGEDDEDNQYNIPADIAEKIQLKEQRKWEAIVYAMKSKVQELQSKERDRSAVEKLSHLDSNSKEKEMEKIFEQKSKLEMRNVAMQKELKKWGENMKVVEMRQQYNDKLRRSWQAQLQQMEQALLLSNQINNQTRTKFNETIRQKDEEIANLKEYVTNILHQQRTMSKRRHVAKPVNRRPVANKQRSKQYRTAPVKGSVASAGFKKPAAAARKISMEEMPPIE